MARALTSRGLGTGAAAGAAFGEAARRFAERRAAPRVEGIAVRFLRLADLILAS